MYYKIKTKNYEFFAIILDTEFEYRIQFGGTRECINISVYKDDAEANLNGISFDNRCSVDEQMIPGEGTIQMLKTALKFTRLKYKEHCKSMMFKDHSRITCDKHIKIPLYYFYLTKYGKTWYQDKFNAKLYNKNDVEKIENALKFIKDPANKIEFDEFNKKYIRFQKRFKDLDKTFKPIYDRSKNYYEFLNEIVVEFDCGIFDRWFSIFWNDICTLNFGEVYWKIKGTTIDSWDNIEIESTLTKPKFKRVQDGGFYPYGSMGLDSCK